MHACTHIDVDVSLCPLRHRHDKAKGRVGAPCAHPKHPPDEKRKGCTGCAQERHARTKKTGCNPTIRLPMCRQTPGSGGRPLPHENLGEEHPPRLAPFATLVMVARRPPRGSASTRQYRPPRPNWILLLPSGPAGPNCPTKSTRPGRHAEFGGATPASTGNEAEAGAGSTSAQAPRAGTADRPLPSSNALESVYTKIHCSTSSLDKTTWQSGVRARMSCDPGQKRARRHKSNQALRERPGDHRRPRENPIRNYLAELDAQRHGTSAVPSGGFPQGSARWRSLRAPCPPLPPRASGSGFTACRKSRPSCCRVRCTSTDDGTGSARPLGDLLGLADFLRRAVWGSDKARRCL